MAVEAFISYSHRDEALRQHLVSHLSSLEHQGLITAWHDRKITGGEDWAVAIDQHINQAGVILLLVSSDFLSSRYCYSIEMRRALERAATGSAVVIPIILRACRWEGEPFGHLQALPREGRPVMSWDDCDEAFADVAEGIGAILRRGPDQLPPATLTRTVEREYLQWLSMHVQNISHQWHETPIQPTPAHMKKPLGPILRFLRRSGLYRYDPNDYCNNPALSDSELSVRAGFGRRKKIHDLAEELRDFAKIVVLGDPGSGKSVCLRQLAYNLAQQELARRKRPRTVPVFVDMGAYDGWEGGAPGQPLRVVEFLARQLRAEPSVREAPRHHPLLAIADNLEALLHEGRITCIFDALDEMPQGSYQARYETLKQFMSAWEPFGNRFVFSCRCLDYDPAFDVDEVIIDPFDRGRVRKFLRQHVPEKADDLFQRIVEDESLEEMVSNPFMLQALAYINKSTSLNQPHIPATRGELIRTFAEQLLAREAQDKQPEALTSLPAGLDTLRCFLSDLAFAVQQRREGGTSVATASLAEVWQKYPDWALLVRIARRVRLLGKRGEPAEQDANRSPYDPAPPERIEFVHHRLQEYFAALELARRLSAPAAGEGDQGPQVEQYLEDIWWQETVILTVGLVNDPCALLRRMLAPRPEVNAWVAAVAEEAEKPLTAEAGSPAPRTDLE